MHTKTQLHVFVHLHLSFGGSANWSKAITLLYRASSEDLLLTTIWKAFAHFNELPPNQNHFQSIYVPP